MRKATIGAYLQMRHVQKSELEIQSERIDPELIEVPTEDLKGPLRIEAMSERTRRIAAAGRTFWKPC
jgi:hypothetical protein